MVDPGQLLLIERRNGQLYASELVALTPTRFYRANDPGAVLFEIVSDAGSVTGLARSEASGWLTFSRLPEDAA